MTPDLQNQLASILSFLESSLKTGAAFTMDQAPDIVNQLLLWKFVQSLSIFILGFLGTCIAIGWGIFCLRKKDWENPFNDSWEFLALPAVLGAFPLTGMFLSTDWLQIWLAPKIYLLEYASKLLK